mmetsp:Transcript_54985/g.67392  ORF Transcript_54985/g.67392 Transcript_54985/m.67392 type:complete len:190 (-) Transcript_54985:93-662(-)
MSIFPSLVRHRLRNVLNHNRLTNTHIKRNFCSHHELSQTSWKEKRFYRYYRFSENVNAYKEQRGYMAGAFVWAGIGVIVGLCLLKSLTISSKHRYTRIRRRSMEYGSDYHKQLSTMVLQGFCDTNMKNIRASGHDGQTRADYYKNNNLHDCMNRDKQFTVLKAIPLFNQTTPFAQFTPVLINEIPRQTE